jgi:hypothetical protein
VVESSGLLNRRTDLNLFRGFESPPLRQNIIKDLAVFRGLRRAVSDKSSYTEAWH